MAPDAVVGLVERLLGGHAGVGQGEAVAGAVVVAGRGGFGQAQHGDAVALDGFDRDQGVRVDAGGGAEQGAVLVRGAAGAGQRGPGGIAHRQVEGVGVGSVLPDGDVAGEGGFGQGFGDAGLQGGAQGGAVEIGGVGVFPERLALDEQALAGVHRIEAGGLGRDGVEVRLDGEERGEERVQRGGEGDDQLGFVLGIQRVRRGTGGEQTEVEFGLGGEVGEEAAVEGDETFARGKGGGIQIETGGRLHGSGHPGE